MAWKTLSVLLKASLLCTLVISGTADLIDDLEFLNAQDDNSGKANVSLAKCFYENQEYGIGAEFVGGSCSKLCTCLTGGHWKCVPLCSSSSSPACSANSHMVMEPIPSKDPTGKCKCHRPTCVLHPPARVGKCHIEGKEHNIGDQFADSNCIGWCTCLRGGNVACRSLCPRSPSPLCNAANSQLRPTMVASRDPTGKCKCPRLVCELRLAEECFFEGTMYNVGEKFANSACTSSCTCRRGEQIQCVSMCPPLASPMCSLGSHLLIKEAPSADPTGRCRCHRPVCAPKDLNKAPNGRCFLEGQSFSPNENFIDKRCLGKCRCLPHGGVMCFPLCPTSGIMCSFEEQVKGRRPMDKDGRCFCRCNESSIAI